MNPTYLGGLVFGALIGSVFIGGLLGWAVHRVSVRRIPIQIADAMSLVVVAVAAGFTNNGVGDVPAILIYGCACFVAYFILAKYRSREMPIGNVARYEPQLERSVAAALAVPPARGSPDGVLPEARDNRAVKRVIGGVMFTILGAIGTTFVFSAIKQVVSPSLFGGSAEFSFLIGAVLLIPCIFIWRGLIR